MRCDGTIGLIGPRLGIGVRTIPGDVHSRRVRGECLPLLLYELIRGGMFMAIHHALGDFG